MSFNFPNVFGKKIDYKKIYIMMSLENLFSVFASGSPSGSISVGSSILSSPPGCCGMKGHLFNFNPDLTGGVKLK